MFAVKWAVNSVVETAVETTTHTVNLMSDNIRYQTNNLYYYFTHFNSTPAATMIENYHAKTEGIIARHEFRKQEAMAKKMQSTPEIALKFENFRIRLDEWTDKITKELKVLEKSYFQFSVQNAKKNKQAELKALQHLLQAENFAELHLFAKYEFNTLWMQTKKISPVLELFQEILSVKLPSEQVLALR